MQPQEIEKIKELIKLSTLLSPPEKEEWLALAGIMNDKQLLELRKILASTVASFPPTTSPSATFASKVALGTPPSTFAKASADRLAGGDKAVGIPPMKHILNLPKVGAVFPHGDRVVSSPHPSPPPQGEGIKEAGRDKGAGFWKRIKEVLAEKELPVGHPEAMKELELPAPVGWKIRKSSFVKIMADKSENQKPEREKREERVEKGKMGQAKLVVPRPPTAPKAPQKPIVLSVAAKSPLPLGEKDIEDKLFVPGLKDTRILVEAKLAKPKAPSHPITTPFPSEAEPPLSALSTPVAARLGRPLRGAAGQALVKEGIKTGEESPVNINNLDQVSGLTPKDMHKDLAPALKHLTANFGYHQILQALEKSPIFTAYIKTGLEALAGKGDLDRQSGDYLKREEFERFVDVLRTIKN